MFLSTQGLLRHWYPAGIFDTKYLATRLVRLPDDGGFPNDFSSGLGDLYDRLRDPASAHMLAQWTMEAQEQHGALEEWVAPLVAHAPGYEQYAVCCSGWVFLLYMHVLHACCSSMYLHNHHSHTGCGRE